jgi:ABC-type nitrate/sulfonate/bicarbonate transport system ATPase subunit
VNAEGKIEPIIEVNGMTKSFNGHLIWDRISFNINKGEIFSILGPSGSGKTTLLRCLIGVESIDSADDSIKIEGQNSCEYLKKKRISFVPQRYSNFPWLNVFDNIKLGMMGNGKEGSTFMKPRGDRREEAEKRSQVMEIIETVGLTGFENYSIGQLSGGMQQRVAIGRAIAQDTDIIAFDEPFGALDFKIREKLQLLVKNLKKTMLFVTHDIEEAIFVANTIVVLAKGPALNKEGFKLGFGYRENPDLQLKFHSEFVRQRQIIQSYFEHDNTIV